ncbi:transketolase [bacterium]|nr:transketolase [bacterium]|tara:strand:- start:4520 stop:6487 length:1968 start_codon:yes stop_codon:yes gene_type:complete
MDLKIPNALRFLSIDAVERANSGHPGMPMGMADVATILFQEYLKFDSSKPSWPDRDRFVLSNGHGSMLIYSLQYLLGYPEPSLKEIMNFRRLGSKAPGHPEYKHTIGVETTTGPLAQGLGNAVGMALAERIQNSKYGDEIVSHFTYAFVGDGCLMEGLSHEVLSLAGHLKLNKLIVFFDDNKISIDGPTNLSTSDNTESRIKSYNWNYVKIDGHNHNKIRRAIETAQRSKKPTMIACSTKIGYGSPNKEGSEKSHGAALGKEEVLQTRKNLKWNYEPFKIPPSILKKWRKAGSRSKSIRLKWESNLSKSNLKRDFNSDLSPKFSQKFLEDLFLNFKKNNIDVKKVSTRKASEKVLEVLKIHVPQLIGGSADLTPSNNTKIKSMSNITSKNYSGDYIHYGIREHGMASIMNGLSLHKGVIPYGGTFLVFSDYCRPSIRLSAMMGIKVIYVMTHDSIGLGEDGPTHQPVEHLASLRAIPNLKIYRPCDINETFHSWIDAITSESPSLIALSRQNLDFINGFPDKLDRNLINIGAQVIHGSLKIRDLTLLSSGSEVEIAYSAAKALKEKGKNVTVLSVNCLDKFLSQPASIRRKYLGDSPIISVEAGLSLGWKSFFDDYSNVVSIETFGASAPKDELYKFFKINKNSIVKKALKILSN